MNVCCPQLKQYTEIPLSKTCFCPVLCLLLDGDSIVAQAAGMKGPFLNLRIDNFLFCSVFFFLLTLVKNKLKLM